MAFGGGLRFCSGADFARLQIAIFLHCLVTKYGLVYKAKSHIYKHASCKRRDIFSIILLHSLGGNYSKEVKSYEFQLYNFQMAFISVSQRKINDRSKLAA